MTHKLEYHASKTRKLLDALNDKRDEALKRDRLLREINEEIDALKSELSEAETAAANDGHSVAELHEAAAAIEDKPKGKK